MAVNIQLKDFAENVAPVPADIIYSANSADSFNEVKITIENLIAAYPGLLSIGELTTTANEIIYTTGADTYATAAITAFGRSVIALSAGVTAPTAGDFSTWDANKNLSANNFLFGFTSTVSAAGTTTLTVASTNYQEITGSTTQTVVMPVASTMVAGTPFTIINNSSGAVTVNSSGGNLIQTLAAGTQVDLVLLINSGTTAASWQASYIPDSGVISGQGTANQILVNGTSGSPVGGNLIFTLPNSVQINTAILGSLGHVVLAISDAASAVNYIQVNNNAAGNPVGWQALGADTDISYSWSAKGAGFFYYATTLSSSAVIYNTGTGYQHTSRFTFPNTASDRTYTWPDAAGTVSVPQMGTFTPVFTSSGGGTATYSTQTGTYTVIGDRCYFDIVIVLSGLPSAGNVSIAGLPFTCTESAVPVLFPQNLAVGVTAPPICNVPASTASVTIWTFAAGTPTLLTVAQCATNSVFVISGFYKIT